MAKPEKSESTKGGRKRGRPPKKNPFPLDTCDAPTVETSSLKPVEELVGNPLEVSRIPARIEVPPPHAPFQSYVKDADGNPIHVAFRGQGINEHWIAEQLQNIFKQAVRIIGDKEIPDYNLRFNIIKYITVLLGLEPAKYNVHEIHKSSMSMAIKQICKEDYIKK